VSWLRPGGEPRTGLDRFAQFFISPLISEDGVEREINAVNNENSKNLLTDAWRCAVAPPRASIARVCQSTHKTCPGGGAIVHPGGRTRFACRQNTIAAFMVAPRPGGGT